MLDKLDPQVTHNKLVNLTKANKERMDLVEFYVQTPSATNLVNRITQITAAVAWESGNGLRFPSSPWPSSSHLLAGLDDTWTLNPP